jgi:cell division transport system ATP-binding protein
MIIADEPTWNLDPNTSDEIMEILNDINKDWKTIIIATHDKHIVNNAWKRVISFENKTIVSDEKKWDYFFN